MTLLGFKGVHPAALLLFPLALLILFGGFLLLRHFGGQLSARQQGLYRKVHGLLCVVSVLALFAVSSHNRKYMLVAYASVLAAFALLNAALATLLLALRYAGRTQTQGHQPARRRFLAASVFLATGSMTAMAGVGTTGSFGQVRTRHVQLSGLPGIAPGREVRISLVSDLHAGFFLPQEYLVQALSHVRTFAPDVILFGGDLVEYELSYLDETSSFLHALVGIAPVYSVLGNHDCYADSAAMAAWQRSQGIRVLRGEAVELSGQWGRVHLCGLPDVTESRFSFDALKSVPNPAAALVLVHNPSAAMHVPDALVPWLTMSGHTHGGQICVPGLGGLVNQADRRILSGLNTLDGRRVLLTPGLGYSGLPVRVSCPPEVTNLSIA